MASVAHPGLFSFAHLTMDPASEGDYQKVGTLLMVMGWIHLVGLALSAVVGLMMLLFLGITGAMMGAMMWEFMGPLPAMLEGAMFVVMLIVLLFILGIGVAFLYWNSWLYAKWVGRDARALQHVMIFAIVGIVLNGLSGISGNMLSLGLVVLDVLLLVWGQSEQAKAAFQGSPVPPRSDSWHAVE